MKVRDAIREGEATLRAEGVASPRLDAEVLLAFVLGTPRDLLPAQGSDALDPEPAARFNELIRRRGAREPLQYLTGVQEFYSLEFAVDPRVLIPRPETELLVDEIVTFARERGEGLTIADVGTGSGCIAVAAAASLRAARAVALAVSAEGLAAAPRTAAGLGVAGRVSFLQGDLLGPIVERSLDAVLCNPPYVATGEVDGLQQEVREHEPVGALVG